MVSQGLGDAHAALRMRKLQFDTKLTVPDLFKLRNTFRFLPNKLGGLNNVRLTTFDTSRDTGD